MNKQTHSMPCAPQNKIQRATVPKADQNHGADLRYENDDPCRQLFSASQGTRYRVEEIRTKPLRQRHVPGIPELGQVRFKIRGREIFGQTDAE